jgi:hypothetical protein
MGKGGGLDGGGIGEKLRLVGWSGYGHDCRVNLKRSCGKNDNDSGDDGTGIGGQSTLGCDSGRVTVTINRPLFKISATGTVTTCD